MSAAPNRPSRRTASMCSAAEGSRLTHSFKLVGSTLHRGLGVGKCVRSATFTAGGHHWCIQYYPDGKTEESKGYVAVFLELVSKDTLATVHFDLRLVNQVTGLSKSLCSRQTVFEAVNKSLGTRTSIKKSDLGALGYLKDDCLEIECDITVMNLYEIDVPPSDLVDNLGKLLESEEGVDVTFRVKEEVFRAHKIVLAMRSPVFKAQLYGGSASDKGKGNIIVFERKRNIIVEDMEPPVFKALLHFIYKDSLPAMGDLCSDENQEMAKKLLAAADRYGMERMKLVCESILCKRLAIESVAATSVLADRYHCRKLQDDCIRFINSSDRINDVVASQGYGDLKRECPAVAVEMWEKLAKSRKV